jgi:hypothetical protein
MPLQISISNAIGSRGVTAAVSDPDAQAFITAAAITDPTQQAAINTLVVDLKAYSIWTKMKALYPFVTDKTVEADIRSQMKFNLKDPRDLDAAFRLTWGGGGSWSSNGYTPNGINGFADTKLKIQTNISATSHAFGIYSRTNNTAGTQVWGGFNSSTNLFIQNNLTAANFSSGTSSISYTANPSTGLLLATRRSATDFQAYRSNVSLGTSATNTTSVFNGNVYFGARNTDGTANLFSVHQLAFGFFSDGLSATEAANLYTAVQNFNTALARQV